MPASLRSGPEDCWASTPYTYVLCVHTCWTARCHQRTEVFTWCAVQAVFAVWIGLDSSQSKRHCLYSCARNHLLAFKVQTALIAVWVSQAALAASLTHIKHHLAHYSRYRSPDWQRSCICPVWTPHFTRSPPATSPQQQAPPLMCGRMDAGSQECMC